MGESTATKDILVNGVTFPVTLGLEAALQHLRYEDRRRILWIDAICIDQSSNEEKSVQVPIMSDIYRRAEVVRAWVGIEKEEADGPEAEAVFLGEADIPGFQFKQHVHVPDTPEDWSPKKLFEVLGLAEGQTEIDATIEQTLKDPRSCNAWRTMSRILQRPYWTRVWIQQEVMCASKVVIQFGTQEIPLDLFHQAFASAQKYTSQFMTVSEKWLSSPAILTAFGERVAKLLTRKAELEGSLSSQFMNWQLSMLESQFEMKCKDCKDKIYGLIGVMDVWQNGKLKVNYELPVEDVYTQAFKQFVGASESLDIMCSQPRFPADLRMANLPSWCPDWSQGTDPKDCRFESPEDVHKRPPQTLYRGGIEDYIAAGGSRPVVQFLDCNKILLAKGLQFDIIERTSEELFEISLQKGDSDATAWYNLEEMAVAGRGGPYWSWWAFQRFRLEWKIPDDRGKFGMAQDFIEYGSDLFTGITGRDIREPFDDQLEAFWQTMLAGRMPSQGYHNVFKDWRLPKGFTLIYDVVCRRRKHTQLRDLKPDLRKAFESQSTLNLEEWIESCAMIYRHGCKPCINNQRFCTTENKYMGLFPKDTQVGDLVCVLFGCGMPVILRPYKDGYQFIGEAYVHGWMDGEAMRRYYFGKLSAKTFKIY